MRKVEARDDAVRSSLYEKASGTVRQRAYDIEFVRSQSETTAVIVFLRSRVWHEDLRRRLFTDRTRNLAVEGVTRRLGAKPDGAIALSDRLEPVFEPEREDVIIKRFPAFINYDKRRGAV